MRPARRRRAAPSPAARAASYAVLGCWTCVVLFPLYWLAVTSLKTPIDVFGGPFYLPFVDFHPTLSAWRYIFVDLRNDTLRPYANTVVVATTSSVIALVLGSAAAYGLARFPYRPRLGAILLLGGCVALAVVALSLSVPLPAAVLGAAAVFAAVWALTRGRFRRSVTNDDIAFWMISQRILPPVAVVIPVYVLFQRLHLLDTRTALVATYVASNLPIVVWLMRDYFRSLPVELEECAAVDGASRYRIFWSIVLPPSVPGLVATFLFVLVFAWNEYLFALFLTSARAQTLPLTVAAQNATRGPQWWYMSVLILIMIVPVIAMAIALERYMARGLLVGAVKG